jgi:hypothetical protein
MAFIGTHAAIAAAHKRRLELEEEELMTAYTPADLADDWEFKILRCAMREFRNPDVFQAAVEEESLAGWELLEKLDDYRIRFKRPRRARENDVLLPPDVDPYRTTYRGSSAKVMMKIIAVAVLVPMIAAIVIVSFADNPDSETAIALTVGIAAAVFVVLLMLVVGRQR